MGTFVALRFFLRRSRNNITTLSCVAAVRVRKCRASLDIRCGIVLFESERCSKRFICPFG
ncbi:MAG: hypothetical protein IPK82_20555 [Polyangiaceae bacterium]|nr:hypothetical protein [Polyangiaceae bacterium]MBK8255037.1 hypothetical protein [Polyangiaceae bacterium]